MAKTALYFIALMPPAEIAERVHAFKEEFAERFNSSYSLKVPAHITLIPPVFIEPELMEQNIALLLRQFAGSHKPFTITLKDFKAFKPRVIYIDVPEKDEIKTLYKELAAALRRTGWFPSKVITGAYNPHMTIAYRNLEPNDFELAWSEFSHRKFSASFKTDHITLLKHNRKHWEILDEYRLGKVEENILFA